MRKNIYVKFLPVLFCAVLLSGCKTVEQERAELVLSATPHDLCYHASNPQGGPKKVAASQIINSRQLQCDWTTYAQLHSIRRQQELAAAAQLGALGNQLMIAGQPRPVIYSPPAIRTTNCRYIGQTLNCMSF